VTAETFTAAERERSLANLRLERDAIVLYDRLAGLEKDPRRATAFRTIASNERRHAEIWATRLREAGTEVPPDAPPRLRIRFILAVARVFGTKSVSDLVKALEGDEEELYEAQGDPDVAGIMEDEREHAEIWHRLDAGLPGVATDGTEEDFHAGGDPSPNAAETAEARTLGAGAETAAAGAGPAGAGSMDSRAAAAAHVAGGAAGVASLITGSIAPRRDETWHRAGQAGTLRAAIFGVSDGLVSNLALVMGVAGAAVDNRFIVLAGIAGLLAGAFSMAAGEWVSMQSQRELFERQIDIEREELKIMPEAEEQELAGIYRAKGLSRREAELVAHRLMQDPEMALDTKVREELGLDPSELGSPWGAAAYSCATFAIGAALPLLPFLLTTGGPAIVASVVLALSALFLVGAAVSLLTGRSALFSGARQVAIGSVAAAVTYVVGLIIGVQVS
jgi:VIT1/CCC1 family predicted Fe2+/Mn2+ transporter